jgi:hypothetical protein
MASKMSKAAPKARSIALADEIVDLLKDEEGGHDE